MKRLPKVSDSEWRVMRVLWARSPATAQDVIEALESETTWKPKTVMTLLNRLAKKGALGFEKRGRAYHYFPLVEEAALIREASRSFLDRVYGGALEPMLAYFLEDAELSAEEIEGLKRLLERKGEEP